VANTVTQVRRPTPCGNALGPVGGRNHVRLYTAVQYWRLSPFSSMAWAQSLAGLRKHTYRLRRQGIDCRCTLTVKALALRSPCLGIGARRDDAALAAAEIVELKHAQQQRACRPGTVYPKLT
jgi:hypothetical protein